MKKWIDTSEIDMIHEMPTKELRKLDKEMRAKPNFDKTKNEFKKKRPNILSQDKRKNNY